MIRLTFLALIPAMLVLAACQSAPAPQAVSNAEFVRRCSNAVNERQLEVYRDCWAEGARNNGFVVQRDRITNIMDDIIRTFPDYNSEIIAIVSEGDWVVTQSMQRGTHRGVARTNFNGGGLMGVAPTGKKMEIRTTHWWKIVGGKIVEHQAIRDDLTMMRQLGLAPPPPQ